MENNKFLFSPGLPGIGFKGNPGDSGISGLATYFSSYSGDTDSISIKSKIVANKLLFSVDEYLPGYPNRIYQDGDQFIDKNGKVFQIDFSEFNLYKSTGQQLNSSGFFEQGPNTVNTPVYSRYSNAFTLSKFLIDVVYVSSPVGNYGINPSTTDGSIYGIGAVDFAQIKYVDNNINSYHPFTVYSNSTDVTHPERAIALVKENGNNVWHLGNEDGGGNLRDVSLYLDFKDIFVSGNFYTNNKLISNGDVSLNGTNVVATKFKTGLLNVIGDASINGILYSNDLHINGNHYIEFLGANHATNYISTADNDNTNDNTNSLALTTGNCSGVTASKSGNIILKTGYGGSTAGNGGDGGAISINTGIGGQSGSGSFNAGDGGDISIGAGQGGTDITGGSITAGKGGNIFLLAGKGGGSTNQPGDAGNITIQGGQGNNGNVFFTYGGNVYIIGGKDYNGSYGGYSGVVYIGCDSNNATIGQTRFGSGSSSVPSISFRDDNNTGFYNAVNDRISVATGSTENFRFDSSTFYARGNVVAELGNPFPSDIRLKTNIEDLNDSLNKILGLRGVSYNRKNTNEKHIGFIAQELEKIIPEIIIETNLLSEPDEILYKAINYNEIIPYLTEAIKEQQKMINILKTELKEIKLKINK